MNNYTVIHLHSDLSSGITNIDSVTKYSQYIDYAKSLGMKALAFSEHGSVFSWVKKKDAIEAAGMKYIHAEEFYVTKTTKEKIRDNWHCLLIALNYDGVKELNMLSSKSFNREDGHFYYVPRITFDELLSTSNNIIISTACLGGILVHADDDIRKRFIRFLAENNERCYLEIQHHNVEDQIKYNRYLYELSQKYNIPLIAMTDTHALNEEHLLGRSILQQSKNIHFENEDGWDLTFKTYDELVEAYKKQNALSMDIVLEAIENTNRLADRVEEFTLDKSYKYPHLWKDSEKLFIKKIKEGIKRRGVDKYPNREEYADRIRYEMKAYKHNGAIDFMLLMEDIVSWCRDNDIGIGYGRGSVNGSIIAWLLGITEMDSIKHKLNFDRFMNIERVSLSDIDTDFPPSRIEEVKQYVFNHPGLYCSDIITFNTIADKGAIRDVVRALYKGRNERSKLSPEMQKEYDEYYARIEGHDSRDMDVSMPSHLQKAIDEVNGGNYITITNDVLALFEQSEDDARQKYPEIFKYVDMVKGTIISCGNHPCGMIVSPTPLDDEIGLCTTSTDTCAISQIYMKEIDSLNYVKLDLLKLDTIELINNTCKLAGIERCTPDNLDITDVDVWNSMRDDTTAIFQWEGRTGDDYIKKLLSDKNIEKFKEVDENIDRMTLLSIGNSAIRPAGASYRDDLANGIVRESGSEAIDDFLKPTFGYLVFQCQVIEFLHEYCGFTMGEADVVRRHFAKKTGTEEDIPRIKAGFIDTMKDKYHMSTEEAEKSIVAFLQVIEDASNYLFSINHSQPYSYEGYACGWLRYYYPVEFLTCALNINKDNDDKTKALTNYANKVGIKIMPIKFRHSTFEYTGDTKNKCIYKAISSIKHMNDKLSQELHRLRDKQYDSFIDLLVDIGQTSCDSRQLGILIDLGFFDEFGHPNQLNKQVEIFNKFYGRKQIKKDSIKGYPEWVFEKHCDKSSDKMYKFSDTLPMLIELCSTIDYPKTTIKNRIQSELEHLGYIQTTLENISDEYYYVNGINGNWLTLYQLHTGDTIKIKSRKKYLQDTDIDVNKIIKIIEIKDEQKWCKDAMGEWYRSDETEPILTRFLVLK